MLCLRQGRIGGGKRVVDTKGWCLRRKRWTKWVSAIMVASWKQWYRSHCEGVEKARDD
jgi:hypothetical protein